MSGRNAGLTLVVSANTDAFDAKRQSISRALDTLAKDGGDFKATFDKIFDTVSADPAAAIRKMSAGLKGEIQSMMREARSAAELGKDFNPVGGMSAAGSLAQAANYDKIAQALRGKMEAGLAAAKADEQHALAGKQLEAQLYPEIRALEKMSAQLREQAGFLAAVEGNMESLANQAGQTGTKVGAASGAMKSGMQQLSFQVNDVATQFAAGTPPMVIFAQQGGQVAQAVGLMAGESKGLLGFLGGPWGIAILSAGTVLLTLVSKTDMFSSAAERAKNKLADNAEALDKVKGYADRLGDAQSVLGKMFDLATGAIKNQNEELRTNAALLSAQLRAGAASKEASSASVLAKAASGKPAMFDFSKGLFQDGPQEVDNRRRARELKGMTERVTRGEVTPSQAVKWASNFNFTGLQVSREEWMQAVIDRGQAKADKETADAMDGSVSSGKLDPRFKEDPKPRSGSGRDNRTNQQVWQDFDRELKARGIKQASGRTGFRTAKDQREIFNAGESPLDGTKRVSRHQTWQAFDPTGASHNDAKAYEAAQAAGLEGFKVVRESGGRVHYEWKGHRAPGTIDVDGSEQAAKAAEAEAKAKAEKAARDKAANEAALAQADLEALRAKRDATTDLVARAALDKQIIDVERARAREAEAAAAAERNMPKADLARLQATNDATAEAKKAAIDAALQRELFKRFRTAEHDLALKKIEAQQDELQYQADLLELQGQMAPTLKERAAIAMALLENDRQQAKLANDRELQEKRIDPATHAKRAERIDSLFDGRANIVARQNQGPLADYRDQLIKNVGDIDEALEGVKARGLQSLEDGLVGIISGTENVASAFKRMAASILADLARIAIEKAILSIFSFNQGTVPGTATGHATGMIPGFAGGVISGPGTGTSDSILAWHQGMGLIRVSNGESIITAEGTRKHRNLLKAINDNTLPSFAGGMIDVSQVNYPATPRMAALSGRSVQQHFTFDLRGALTTPELLAQVNSQISQVGMAAMIGGSQMAQQELAERRYEAIP